MRETVGSLKIQLKEANCRAARNADERNDLSRKLIVARSYASEMLALAAQWEYAANRMFHMAVISGAYKSSLPRLFALEQKQTEARYKNVMGL